MVRLIMFKFKFKLNLEIVKSSDIEFVTQSQITLKNEEVAIEKSNNKRIFQETLKKENSNIIEEGKKKMKLISIRNTGSDDNASFKSSELEEEMPSKEEAIIEDDALDIKSDISSSIPDIDSGTSSV